MAAALLRVSVEKDNGTYLMVTNNVQSSALHMHRLYDLKGSDREASDKEKVRVHCVPMVQCQESI